MQRINLFTNPVFAGPLTGTSHWGDANGTVRDNALHVTGTSGGYGFNVAVPFNVPLVLSVRVDASEDRRGRQPQHHLPWRGQFDVGGLGRVRGRRMADRPTTPPPVPVVRRRLDAPAVIGGERR